MLPRKVRFLIGDHALSWLDRFVEARHFARMAFNPTMSRAERESFLAGVHIGVFAVAQAGRGPCAVPVWYHYTAGSDVIHMTMPESSLKLQLLSVAGRASLCVQQEARPTKYVSVEGPVVVVDDDVSPWQREIAQRYLGPKLAPRYLLTVENGPHRERVVVMRPERWWSVDHSKAEL